jgi:hypothetical protein
MIWDAARAYLNTDNQVRVTLFPEEKTETRPVEQDRDAMPAIRRRPAA